jgi:hypothetical protein
LSSSSSSSSAFVLEPLPNDDGEVPFNFTIVDNPLMHSPRSDCDDEGGGLENDPFGTW